MVSATAMTCRIATTRIAVCSNKHREKLPVSWCMLCVSGMGAE